MRVPDHVLNSIAFLGFNEVPGISNTAKFAGSGSIVGVELDDILFFYLVTADHVAKELNNYEESFVRINDIEGDGYVSRLGRKGFESSSFDPWHRHPTDPSADVAIQTFIPPAAGQNDSSKRSVAYIPETIFVKEEQFTKKGLGIGDEVFVSGLFHFSRGEQSNSPILRVGNIAMVPKEKVLGGRDYGLMDAVLVDVQSIGGLSGSPVFVRPTVNVAKGSRGKVRRATVAKASSADYYLLGIIHGHWEENSANQNQMQRANGQPNALSNGISIATPARKILETLYQPCLLEQREDVVKKLKSVE